LAQQIIHKLYYLGSTRRKLENTVFGFAISCRTPLVYPHPSGYAIEEVAVLIEMDLLSVLELQYLQWLPEQRNIPLANVFECQLLEYPVSREPAISLSSEPLHDCNFELLAISTNAIKQHTFPSAILTLAAPGYTK
jgi:hypothetical protein